VLSVCTCFCDGTLTHAWRLSGGYGKGAFSSMHTRTGLDVICTVISIVLPTLAARSKVCFVSYLTVFSVRKVWYR
jgi:hypothetical protein